MDKFAEGLLWYVAFLFSTTLHEASHAFVGLKLGDRTAYEGGQVTLNPIPHMRREPIGTILIPIVSFLLGGWMIGWASVPYNPQWAYDNPRSSAKMSAAGPAANLLLTLLSAVAIRIGLFTGLFLAPDTIGYAHVVDAADGGALSTLAVFVNVFFSLNLLLFVFNLLPIPPLDGSGIIPWFLKKERAQKYFELIHNQSFSFFGLLVAWKVFDVLYDPLYLFFINLLFFGEAEYR